MRQYFATIVLLIGSSPAFAHQLHVTARLDGDRVRVEAYYSDDTPAQEARITISNGDQIVAEGQTDEKGVWTCVRPKPGSYAVKAQSVGHAAENSLTISESSAPPPTEPPADDERKQRTKTPWPRLAAGLGMIGGMFIAWLIVRRSLGKAHRAV
jgi:hypothetical protein